MNTCVCVLSNNGERLMPTFRLGKVRRLLKDGKAKIVKHHPFTIQLLYDSKTNKQPIEICEDVGYNYICISVKSESHEYVSAQYDTLQDEKEHHDDCRKMRRARRNRLRYRKPRFDNRKRSEGWLAPSLEHKKQLNISLVERYVSVIPITHATVEVGSFDTMLLQAIQKGETKPEGADYQEGPRYNLATLREAVFYRDNYTCQVCGRKITDGAILHMHHMFYWKGRHGYKLDELVTACEKCHTPANHQKGGKLFGFGEDKEFADLSGAAFMNAVRWQIVNALHTTYSNRCPVTLWKENKFFESIGKKLTKTTAAALLTKGKAPLKGCVSKKTGKKYDCILTCDCSKGRPEFHLDFEHSGASGTVVGKCPFCGSDVAESAKGYGCTNKDCDAVLWKTSKLYGNDVKISAAAAKALLANKAVSAKIKSKDKTADVNVKVGIEPHEMPNGKKYINLKVLSYEK